MRSVEGDKAKQLMRVHVGFERGPCFVVDGQDEPLPVYDTKENVYRHSNCCTYECELVVQVPRAMATINWNKVGSQ